MARKIALYLLISASVLWLAFIFSNSLADAEKSTEQSSGVTEAVNQVASSVGIDKEIKEATVRTMAHFSEFAVLSALIGASVTVGTWEKFRGAPFRSLILIAISIPVCFVFACIDELLQKLSAGRASEFSDVLTDTLGACCGLAVFALGYLIFIYILKKKKRAKPI